MSTAAQRRALLMPHEARQALIHRPFPITYYPPVKRWGGVQLINDEDWMKDATSWRKRYTEEGQGFETDIDSDYFGPTTRPSRGFFRPSAPAMKGLL